MFSDRYIYTVARYVSKNYGEPVPVDQRDVFSEYEKILECQGGIGIKWSKSLNISDEGEVGDCEKVEIISPNDTDTYGSEFGQQEERKVVYQGAVSGEGRLDTYFYNPYYSDWGFRIAEIAKEIENS